MNQKKTLQSGRLYGFIIKFKQKYVCESFQNFREIPDFTEILQLVETRKVGKWGHKLYKHLRDVPIYCFGQNTFK